MSTQGELENNADLVELVAAPKRKAVFHRYKKAFSSVVPGTAETPTVLSSTKRREFALDIERRF
jgi:hypothetical protein